MTGFTLVNLEQQLLLWMLAMIRPGAAFLVAPIFGARSVPVQIRIILALAIGIPAASVSGLAVPESGVVSLDGLLMIVAELLVGLSLGFAVQIGFAAAMVAGEAMSNSMGLGLASMADPAGGQPSTAIGQFLSMVATFLFLAMGGHLLLIGIILDSYTALPPGKAWLSADAISGIVHFGGLIFALGLTIALPVGFAMILVQIIMGVVARSTPTLNLFAVGIPAGLMVGVTLMAISMPILADALMAALNEGLSQSRVLGKGS